MKFIKIILFSIFMLVCTLNIESQEIQGEKGKIDSLFEIVKKITPQNQNEVIEIKDSDLEKAKQLLYEVYAYAPIEFDNELRKWPEKLRSMGKKGIIISGALLKNVKKKLAEKYGWEYVRFLETPYFMKFKILMISPSFYNIKRTFRKGRKIRIPKINFVVKVLDVVKGKKFYSSGDTITMSYLPIQFSNYPSPKFEINQIYAAPLGHWSKNPSYKELMLKLNGLHTLYKIENNIVYSPLTPKKSPLITWNEFKSWFIHKYLNIEGTPTD
jgi:hypothetical protein